MKGADRNDGRRAQYLRAPDLLCYLMENKGRVYTREQLLDRVWGYDYIGETRTVDVHIRHLSHSDIHRAYPIDMKIVQLMMIIS